MPYVSKQATIWRLFSSDLLVRKPGPRCAVAAPGSAGRSCREHSSRRRPLLLQVHLGACAREPARTPRSHHSYGGGGPTKRSATTEDPPPRRPPPLGPPLRLIGWGDCATTAATPPTPRPHTHHTQTHTPRQRISEPFVEDGRVQEATGPCTPTIEWPRAPRVRWGNNTPPSHATGPHHTPLVPRRVGGWLLFCPFGVAKVPEVPL